MNEFPYLEKELSWLSFNHRVLQEAQDPQVPLLERFRFLGIYSSNMDEFYRVRVADVRRKVLMVQTDEEKEGALNLLDAIQSKVLELQNSFDDTYNDLLLQLGDAGIDLINETQLSESHQQWLDRYYKDKLRRHIFPLVLNERVKLTEHINDDCTYLMVSMSSNDSDKVQYALVEVPSDDVPRFVVLPEENGEQTRIILLDNVIRYSMAHIFKGFFEFDHIRAYSMKLTRDAEIDLSEEFNQSLFEKMSIALKKRLSAVPVRLVYDRKMPQYMLDELKRQLGITTDRGLIAGGRYHSFKDFIDFPNVGGKKLEHPNMPALEVPYFDKHHNAFDAIKERDILLYYPYHRFSYFTEWLRQAAYDPRVRKIEICLYRVAKRSRVVSALTEAVKNGKEVEVNIELRARFDEEDNIKWAEVLSTAGARVTFGIQGLKVHSKICLVTREEEKGMELYAHVGTGNFNERNAQIYTDFSLFTCVKKITKEVAQVFEFLKYPYKRVHFKHLIVSPTNSRNRLIRHIDDEILAAQNHQPSGIILKVNNLVDPGLIAKLYEASNAGVKVQLIIRGICSLVPGVKGKSERIVCISVVDRFLEHPRVCVFENYGDQLVYISSADWMYRNIDLRVEVGCPVYCPEVKQTIIDILNIQLKDTTKARLINTEQSNPYHTQGADGPIRSQMAIYDYLSERNQLAIQAEEEID